MDSTQQLNTIYTRHHEELCNCRLNGLKERHGALDKYDNDESHCLINPRRNAHHKDVRVRPANASTLSQGRRDVHRGNECPRTSVYYKQRNGRRVWVLEHCRIKSTCGLHSCNPEKDRDIVILRCQESRLHTVSEICLSLDVRSETKLKALLVKSQVAQMRCLPCTYSTTYALKIALQPCLSEASQLHCSK
jgi:hypothetical protein